MVGDVHQERCAPTHLMLESELFALLETTGDAAFCVTEESEICYWNKAAERLFGYSQKDVHEKLCHDVLHGHGPLGAAVCVGDCSVQKCAAREVGIPDFDMQVMTRSGTPLWVNVSTIVYRNPRTQRRIIVHLARDVTEQKRKEVLAQNVIDVSRQLVETAEPSSRLDPVLPLSEQERRILQLFAQAKSTNTVARELGITQPTLRNHLHNINEKLRTHNRLEAVMQAMHRGLI